MQKRAFVIVTVMTCAALSSAAYADPTCTNFGDRNGDCRVDLLDHAAFAECVSGPGVSADPMCVCFDSDTDSDVDLADFGAFQKAFTGDALIAACDMTPAALEPALLHPSPPRLALDPIESRDILKTYFDPAGASSGVYEFSGETFLSIVDLQINSRGFDFVWSRKYRSQQGPTTAMGANWDFGYNIFLEQAGNDLIFHDGNSRADEYVRVSGPAGDTWCAADFFREIRQEPNGSFVCTFPHRGEWRFHAFDGSPQEGRITEMADPNGNAMTFTYDGLGRLATITDTLGRPITVGYNSDNRVSSITDFAGRQVTYQYYAALDTLGGEGDLKSVTSPTVTGTPNGNDFPSGKTTTYTYSTGFGDNALNHNLLTVTDPKGQTFLTYTYAQALSPQDPNYDRVARQVLGDPNDVIDYVYEPVAPTSTNGYAVTRAIVNDRNGHVDERLFDRFNRCVSVREYTGQALATSPTSSSVNRPTGKLRATDPDFFEMRFEYNSDSLLARVVDSESSIAEYTYSGDSSFLASPRNKANVVRTRKLPGPRGGNQQEIIMTIEYDANSNGDTNWKTRLVDSRGHDSEFDYDSAGNRTQTTHRISSIVENFEYNSFGQLTAHIHPDNGSGHRRRDEFTYYNAGPQTGYVKDVIVDAPGFALTTTYEHDAVGNVTRVIDPRGNDRLYDFNQLNQVVRVQSREVNPPSVTRISGVTHYDANDNIVRLDIENRDETGALQSETHFTAVYDYDILDNVIRETREVDTNGSIVVEYEYDDERNRTVVRNGEATNGNQQTNTVVTLYDERDLVFQEVRAAGDPLQSTTQYDYDGNGNVVRTAQGLEGTPHITLQGYDGYDRHMPTTDAMGNVKMCQYDANGNRVFHLQQGELQDVPGGASNLRLQQAAFTYDDLDRRTRSDVAFFDPATQLDIDDGLSSTITAWSDNSQIVSVTDDNGNTTSIQYDTANRRSVVTDAKGNTTAYTYDANSNVLTETETAKSDLGLPDEVFVTTYTYDGLDRRISSTDSSGNTTSSGYDSRDNLVVSQDEEGNETRYAYDGLNRLVRVTRDLDGDGADGNGSDIVMTQVWDDSSRLVLRTDDNGNTTTYTYDPLNRLTVRTLQDGTSETQTYDVHDNTTNVADANGTSLTYGYDALNRRSSSTVVVGPGVSSDTTFETFTYDGLNRRVTAQDDDSTVQFTWDSLSNMVNESLGGQSTSSNYDGIGNRLTLTYPSGLSIDYTYDTLNRVTAIHDGPSLVTNYWHVGSDRITMQQYGNGARTTFNYDGIQGVPNPANDFGVKCIVGVTHTAGLSVIDSRSFTWSPTQNKTERRDTRVGGPELRHAYEYDSIYRMTRGVQEDSNGIPTRDLIYNLDGVGNRTSINGFGGTVGPYVLDPASPPADFQVNQYTQTPRDSRQYDENGNTVSVVDPVNTVSYVYDAYDRLVSRTDALTGDVAEYAYDALGRRIRKTVTPGGGSPQETRFYYDGSCVIEEQDGASVTQARYVRGARCGDIVCVESGGQIYYQHSDDQGNAVALTDTNGLSIERYEYDDFGTPQFFDGAGTPLQGSVVGHPYLFGGSGSYYDAESGLYWFDHRYLDPQNGRFITRSSSTMWTSSGSHGNALSYAGSNPWSSGTLGSASSAAMGNHPNIIHFIGAASASGQGGGHVTVLKARGGHHGHVTVLKARGGHHGHVTVLKARGGHHGHVTVLKARGGGNGHVTVLKARGGHNGHVTVLKARGGHNGHVTVLKARGGHNGHVTVLKARGGHNGHVTVLKARGGGHMGSMPMPGGPGAHGHMMRVQPFSGGSGKSQHAAAAGIAGGGGGSTKAATYEYCPPCGMWKAVCTNGRKKGEINILPACNNISSR